MKHYISIAIGLFLFFCVFRPTAAQAQSCAPTRIINQYACLTIGSTCSNWEQRCSWSGERCSPLDVGTSNGVCSDPGDGVCTNYCTTYTPTGPPECRATGTQVVSCTNAAAGCRYAGNIIDCNGGMTGGNGQCTESTVGVTYPCWVTGGGTPDPGGGGGGGGGGSWGGCGSCGSCPPFGGSSECVQAPDGSCRWDPTTCAPRGPTCASSGQGCSSWADTTTCCSGLTCNWLPGDPGYTCGNCSNPQVVARYCGSDPTQWCGQPYICNNGGFSCPNAQSFEIPEAPTGMSPANGAIIQSTGSPSTQLRCNAACTDDADCGANRVEARLNRGLAAYNPYTNFYFIGFLENSILSRLYLSPSTQNPRISLRPPGVFQPQMVGGYQAAYSSVQGAGASMYTGSTSVGLSGWRYSAGSLVDFFINGSFKQNINFNSVMSGQPEGEFRVNFPAGAEKPFACQSGVCRLRANPSDATCTGSPSSGEKFVQLSWNPGPSNSSGPVYREWEVQVVPEGSDCNNPASFCGTVVKSSYRFVPSSSYSRYTWSVRTINDVCTYQGAPRVNGRWSVPQLFIVQDKVDFGSTINMDNSRSAIVVGGVCTASGAPTAYTGGGNVTISKAPFTQTVPVSTTNGSYTFTQVDRGSGFNVRLQLTQPPAGQPQLICSCPVGCQYSNVTVPQNLPFYVSQVALPWFQTQGADIAALTPGSGVSIEDPITAFLLNGAKISKPFDTSNYATIGRYTQGALVVQRSSIVDLDSAAGNQETNISDPNRLVRTTYTNVCKENFDYFYRKFSMGVNPSNDTANLTGTNIPASDRPSGKNAYYAASNLTINSNWALTGNRKLVVFVNGDLTINANITVANSAFLAFIVKGNIIVSPTVGTSDVSQTGNGQVQGVYIANGNLTIQSAGSTGTDLKFIGEGVFAVCGNVRLPRDFQNGGDASRNNVSPTSLFIYRPDMLANTPELMKDSLSNWKEISP